MLRTLRSIAKTTAARRGCTTVRIVQDVENASAITWIEEWESEGALAQHINSDEYRKLLTVMDMSMSAPEIRFHTVTRTAGMELIASQRQPRT